MPVGIIGVERMPEVREVCVCVVYNTLVMFEGYNQSSCSFMVQSEGFTQYEACRARHAVRVKRPSLRHTTQQAVMLHGAWFVREWVLIGART